MIEQFFPELDSVEKVEVKDGETLDLGSHKLTFVFAPMVHWPEVMMTYESTEKILFSAMHSGNSAHVIRTKTGLARQDGTISESLESMALRYRLC